MGNRNSRPQHAPGPSPEDLHRERAMRKQLEEKTKQLEKDKVRDAEERAAQTRMLKQLEQHLRQAQEDIRKKEKDAKDYPVPVYLVEHRHGGNINIAVTGNSGVGKSSFINAIRRLKPDHKDYAKTDSAECTLIPTLFKFPDSCENIWDLPGAGTKRFPQETYVKQMGIRYFDVVILLTAERFTEAETLLKTELESFKVPHFCVRNKIDAALDSKINEEEEVKEEEIGEERKQELKDSLIHDTKEYFQKEYGIQKLYLISSQAKFRKKFDFEELDVDVRREIKNARLDSECPICMESYADVGGPAGKKRKADCGHSFCETCTSAGHLGNECPTCRKPLRTNSSCSRVQ